MATDERKLALRELNCAAWDEDTEGTLGSKNRGLETSLKKNTAFIKKIRNPITKENYKDHLKDIASLSLEKYLIELCNAIFEGVSKITRTEDVAAAVEVVSLLHQRFASRFTWLFQVQVLEVFDMPAPKNFGSFDDNIRLTKDDEQRIARQKNFLRLLVDFYLVGLFDKLDAENIDIYPDFVTQGFQKLLLSNENATFDVLEMVLREIVTFEARFGTNIAIIISFLTRYGNLLAPEPDFSEEDKFTDKLLSSAVQQHLYELLKYYATVFFKYTLKMHQNLFKLKVKIKSASVITGRPSENLNASYDLRSELFERYKRLCHILSETIGVDPLVLPELNEDLIGEDGEIYLNTAASDSNENLNVTAEGVIIWQNDEERRFYTEVPDITESVPEDVFDKKTQTILPGAENKNDMGMEMTKLLVRLEDCNSQQESDEISKDYWQKRLNNKASKNRILKVFLMNQNLSQVKYYARFLAVNRKLLPDLISHLVEKLDASFRYQIFSPEATKMNVKNVHYFSEMVKFNLIELYVVFHKIRALIMNIEETNNVDLLNVYFDQCGRFLYYANGPESKLLMQDMLDLLRTKKREDKTLTLNIRMAIDTLLLSVVPTPLRSINQSSLIYQKAAKTPEQQFVNTLILKELNSRTWPEILYRILALDLTDNIDFILFVFTSPEQLPYENIHILVKMLHWLSNHSSSLLTLVMDSLLEKVQRGLEVFEYKYNRVRMSHIKYLAEILLLGFESQQDLQLQLQIMVKTVNKLITFGYPGIPTKGWNNTLDPSDDYFRISLLMTFLGTFKNLNDFGDNNEFKSQFFNNYRHALLLLNYYILTKKQPIPTDVTFKINAFYQDVELLYVYNHSFSEVVQALRKVFGLPQDALTEQEQLEPYQQDDDDEKVEYDEAQEEKNILADILPKEEFNNDAFKKEYVRLKKEQQQRKIEREMDMQLNNIIVQGIESRRVNDQGTVKRNYSKPITVSTPTNESIADGNSQKVKFTLVRRNRNGKSQTKDINISKEERFVREKIEEQEAKIREQEKLKRIVLNLARKATAVQSERTESARDSLGNIL